MTNGAASRRRPDESACARTRPDERFGPLLFALRPHQWVKNALVFAPLVLAHELGDLARLATTTAGFLCFCGVASAGYLLNDWLDLESDRQHPTRRERPLAAGRLSLPRALVATAVLVTAALGASLSLVSPGFTAMLGLYLVLTLGYSFALKERPIVDVLVLAALYTLRIVAGGVAAGVPVSPWLLAFSVFFFLGLALLKRYVELRRGVGDGAAHAVDVSRRSYSAEDAELVQTMGIVSGYVSVLVLGLYTSRAEVTRFYHSPEWLWLTLPLMLYWISRVWLLARRGEMLDDPVLFALRDRSSWLVFAGIVLVGLAATSSHGWPG